MKDWNGSPFRLMQVEKKSGAFTLKVLATKVDCSSCGAGRASKSRKKAPREGRCLASPPAEAPTGA